MTDSSEYPYEWQKILWNYYVHIKLHKDTLNFSLFVYLSALSLKAETLYAGKEEEGGKGILARVHEEKG